MSNPAHLAIGSRAAMAERRVSSTALSKVTSPAARASSTEGSVVREVRTSTDAVSGATSRRPAVHSTRLRQPSASATWPRSSSASRTIWRARTRPMCRSSPISSCSRLSVVFIPGTYQVGVTENVVLRNATLVTVGGSLGSPTRDRGWNSRSLPGCRQTGWGWTRRPREADAIDMSRSTRR